MWLECARGGSFYCNEMSEEDEQLYVEGALHKLDTHAAGPARRCESGTWVPERGGASPVRSGSVATACSVDEESAARPDVLSVG